MSQQQQRRPSGMTHERDKTAICCQSLWIIFRNRSGAKSLWTWKYGFGTHVNPQTTHPIFFCFVCIFFDFTASQHDAKRNNNAKNSYSLILKFTEFFCRSDCRFSAMDFFRLHFKQFTVDFFRTLLKKSFFQSNFSKRFQCALSHLLIVAIKIVYFEGYFKRVLHQRVKNRTKMDQFTPDTTGFRIIVRPYESDGSLILNVWHVNACR